MRLRRRILLDFANGTPETVPDLSGNKRNGSIKGGKWVKNADSK